MTIHFSLRLLFALIVALLGWKAGMVFSTWASVREALNSSYYPFILALFGFAVGGLGAPLLLRAPFEGLCRGLCRVHARKLLMGAAGIILGLVAAMLLTVPLSMLPGAWGATLPLVAALLLAFVGATTMIVRERDILNTLGLAVVRDTIRRRRDVVLLDTSAIIDGRIADIRKAGFVNGTLVVPRFVLDELQHIADSPDTLRRNRGRRGLDVLNRMQKDDRIQIEISEQLLPEIGEVDAKLVRLAQELDCPVLTNDYNLNRVAELQGVRVLNINELANAVKAVVLPGESLRVQVIQEGKELGQGVGYLDDGTMVVIDDGRRHMNATVDAVVTRVLQTVAGRMIFAQLESRR